MSEKEPVRGKSFEEIKALRAENMKDLITYPYIGAAIEPVETEDTRGYRIVVHLDRPLTSEEKSPSATYRDEIPARFVADGIHVPPRQ